MNKEREHDASLDKGQRESAANGEEMLDNGTRGMIRVRKAMIDILWDNC